MSDANEVSVLEWVMNAKSAVAFRRRDSSTMAALWIYMMPFTVDLVYETTMAM